MPWTKRDYPTSWKNLDAEVRAKAIEIGNALLADGMEDGKAIPIALSQARKALDTDDAGPRDLWVAPQDGAWALKREGTDEPLGIYETQKHAIDEAVSLAKKDDVAVTVQGEDGAIRERQSFRSRL